MDGMAKSSLAAEIVSSCTGGRTPSPPPRQPHRNMYCLQEMKRDAGEISSV